MSSRRRHFLLYFIVICAGLLAGHLFFSYAPRATKDFSARSGRLSAPSPTPDKGQKETLSAEQLPGQISSPFILKGILFSQGKGSALINDAVVKEGDFLEGAEVLDITKDAVELKTKNSQIRLSLKGAIEQKIREQKARPKVIEVPKQIPQALPAGEEPQEAALPIGVSTPSGEQKPLEVEPPREVATRDYMVREGDSLWKIAVKELGSGNRWESLYELNKDRIKDPQVLRPGTKILIPLETTDNP